MSDLIKKAIYGETPGKIKEDKPKSMARNGYKIVTLVNAVSQVDWRHQLQQLLLKASGDLIAGNSASLNDLVVPSDVELFMEESVPQFGFSYTKKTPIKDTIDALLPKGSKGSAVVDIATVAADLTSTFINGMDKDENDVPSVFNPWTKNVPAWNQELHNVKFSYKFNFKMGQYGLWNAKKEVFLPIINLIAPVLPRKIGTFFTEGPIPGQTAILSNSILGALKAGFNKDGGDALATNLLSAVRKYTYNINFGNTVRIENCLIDGAKTMFSSDTDEEGYPIAGSVELQFATISPYGLSSPEGARAIKFGVNT